MQLHFAIPNGSKMSFDVVPLRFSDEKLAQILTRMQKASSAESDEALLAEQLTVGKLRDKVAEIIAREKSTP